MRDVANTAEVSLKTVSRVVNGEDGVSDQLVARVEQAVAALGYHRDDRARHLRQSGSTTSTIGFVLVDVANPFFSSILRGIEDIARQRDYLVLAGSTDGRPEREQQLIGAFVARRVDGLIVVPSSGAVDQLRAEIARGTPVSFLDLEPVDLDGDLVRSDHYGGAVTATNHLLDHGHEQIAFYGDDLDTYSARLRRSGYLDAMSARGITPPPDHLITGRNTVDEWEAIIGEHLRTHSSVTAIFSAQNFISLGAARALHAASIQHQIAQVGFDDVDLATVVEPAITVVPQRPRELGRRAAELLFARIDGSGGTWVQEVHDLELIARGSGEIGPIRGTHAGSVS
jgi:LacI family transcriptional regulator